MQAPFEMCYNCIVMHEECCHVSGSLSRASAMKQVGVNYEKGVTMDGTF